MQKRKINIPMLLAVILFYLTVVSIYLTGGLYARYVTSGTGSDSARVAKFGGLTLTESQAPYAGNTWRIIPGVDLEKKATVAFDSSEVAVYVFLQMELSDHWQTADHKTFTLSQDGVTVMTWELEDAWTHLEDNVYYLHLAPNTPLVQEIIAEDGRITVSEDVTKAQLAQLELNRQSDPICMTFQANAIQSGGFASPIDAWKHLKN